MTRLSVRLYFDGGCQPNPGPIETAVVLRGVADVRRGLPAGDNNDAEWAALLHAAEIAAASSASDVTFLGDSAFVVDRARGARACRRDIDKAYLARFHTLTQGIGRIRIRRVARSQNLAGIVLDRRLTGQS